MRLSNRLRGLASGVRLRPLPDHTQSTPYAPDACPQAVVAMSALDALPEQARYAVYFAAAKHDPVEIRLVMLTRRLSERQTVELIMRTDAHMLKEARQGDV